MKSSILLFMVAFFVLITPFVSADFNESFDRGTSATVGNSWIETEGASCSAELVSNELEMASTGSSICNINRTYGNIRGDYELQFSGRKAVSATNNSFWWWTVNGNGTSETTGTELLYSSNAETLYLRYNGSVKDSISFSMEHNTNYVFVLNKTGTYLRGRVYELGSTEPTAWNLSTIINHIDDYGEIRNKFQSFATTENYYFDNLTLTEANASELNIEIYDELTNEKITNKNFTLTIIGENSIVNLSVTDGDVSLLPVDSGDIEIVYDSELFHQRKYFTTIEQGVIQDIRLYALNKSADNVQLIDFTVTDNSGVLLENTFLKVLRRYNEGGFIISNIVSMGRTTSSGTTSLYLQKNIADYSYILEQNGNVILITGINPLYSSEVTLRASTSSGVISSLPTTNNITGSITYNNNTGIFTFSYNNPKNTNLVFCLSIDRYKGSGITNDINSSCVTGVAGSIDLFTNASIPGRYVATGTVNNGIITRIVDVLDLTEDSVASTIGFLGIFLAVLLFVGAGVMALYNPMVSIIASVAALIIVFSTGLVSIGLGTIMVLVTIAGIMLYAMRRAN